MGCYFSYRPFWSGEGKQNGWRQKKKEKNYFDSHTVFSYPIIGFQASEDLRVINMYYF